MIAASALFAVLAAAPLDEARRHYQRLEYDQALALLTSARAAETDPKQLAEGWLLEGFVQLALGRTTEASVAMQKALRLAPSLQLPGGSSPKLQAAFEEARRAETDRLARRGALALHDLNAPAPPVALRGVDVTVTVDHAWAGLDVRLEVLDAKTKAAATLPMGAGPGGSYSARVPAELAQPGASLRLRARALDDGEALAASPPEDDEALVLALPPHRAAIEIRSPHEGAAVAVDGAAAGVIPLALPVPVEPGAREISLRTREGSVSQRIDVAPGEVPVVTLTVGTTARARAGVGLVATSGALLLGTAIFGLLAGVASRQLQGTVQRESASGLPINDYAPGPKGYVGQIGIFTAAAIVSAVLCAVAGVVGGLLWFGGSR